ncbi:LysM peptidoglycan-binding domain-containing protein [Persephonella sp.]|uniref:LysM peptidoglycan-binding domain-containing protein n=1 Tax=Persephonella sp. TaxID=2060922 RepID=UPI0026174B4E|nr:LysM peptidoglycan-binding domain-containing protein [Persephonella sp.]
MKFFIRVFVLLVIINLAASALTYKVKPGDSLIKIAHKYGVPVKEIIKANHLKKPYKIYIGQKLIIPVKKETKHKKNIKIIIHKVKRGESLIKIAKKYHVYTKDIIELNNLKKPYRLYVGQKLKIPVKIKPKKVSSTTTRKYKTYCKVKHKVKKGESLSIIANRYGISLRSLKLMNHLRSNYIYPGQVLCVRKGIKTTTSRQSVAKATDIYIKKERIVKKKIIIHRVRPGESLGKIARKYGTTVSKLIRLNHLRKPYIIHPGQKLKVEKVEVSYIKKIEKKGNSSLSFLWPVKGEIINKFANTAYKRHLGIDLATDCGVPVRAAESGEVIYAGSSIKPYGKLVIIRHAGKFNTVYAHLGKINVREGQIVRKGDIVGYTGNMENINGCGLYFEIRKNAIPVDPLAFLNKSTK